jgi:ferrous iron transport protein A
MNFPLDELEAGQTGIICAIHAGEELHHRLSALGFRVGKPLQIMRRGCCSGPLHIRLGSTDVMMRRRDAHHIDVHLA